MDLGSTIVLALFVVAVIITACGMISDRRKEAKRKAELSARIRSTSGAGGGGSSLRRGAQPVMGRPPIRPSGGGTGMGLAMGMGYGNDFPGIDIGDAAVAGIALAEALANQQMDAEAYIGTEEYPPTLDGVPADQAPVMEQVPAPELILPFNNTPDPPAAPVYEAPAAPVYEAPAPVCETPSAPSYESPSISCDPPAGMGE